MNQTENCLCALRSCCLHARNFLSGWHFVVGSPQKIKKGADKEDLALCSSDSVLHSLILKHFDETTTCGEYVAVATCDYACFKAGTFLMQ